MGLPPGVSAGLWLGLSVWRAAHCGAGWLLPSLHSCKKTDLPLRVTVMFFANDLGVHGEDKYGQRHRYKHGNFRSEPEIWVATILDCSHSIWIQSEKTAVIMYELTNAFWQKSIRVNNNNENTTGRQTECQENCCYKILDVPADFLSHRSELLGSFLYRSDRFHYWARVLRSFWALAQIRSGQGQPAMAQSLCINSPMGVPNVT